MKRYLNATVKKVTDSGTWTAIASKAVADRDGEVVAPGAFKPLPDTLPVHVDHKFSVDTIVGRATPYYRGDVLYVDGKFASTARGQEVRELVKGGFVDSMSVGFVDATRTQRDGVKTVTSAELVEVSFVTIPSNREALVVDVRNHQPRTRKQIEDEWLRARTMLMVAEAELACLPDDSPNWLRLWSKGFTLVMRGKKLVKELERELKATRP